jgi:hypothetical protein
MDNSPKCNWTGKSGQQYTYEIYLIAQTFREVPGNYIFAKEVAPGRWEPTYIGQTENLNQRLGNHEKEACSKRNGATHIHAHVTNGGEAVRRSEERDLLLVYTTPCNEQYPGQHA